MSPETVLSIEAAVSRFLHSLAEPTRVLVAISGGSDSSGLLVALHDALTAEKNSRFSLCAATIDHDLRAESADEARAVAALCHSLSIPHTTKVWSATKPKAGIMAAAREARYELLADAAAEFGAGLVVTAHTLDDVEETIAMRSQRRAGPASGIADVTLFDRRLWIVRPVLRCRRAQIRNFLVARDIVWLDDPSNDDVKYERVRVRRSLAGEGMASVGAGDGEARAELAAEAANWLQTYFELPAPRLGRIRPEGMAAASEVFAYGLGRLAAVFGGQNFALGRDQIERVLEFLAAGKPGRRTAGRVVFDLRRDGLYLTREDRSILPLSLPAGTRSVWDGRFIVENRSAALVEITKRGEGDGSSVTDDRLPRSALGRSLVTAPALKVVDDANVSGSSQEADVAMAVYFAPFDRFLTRFDFIFAQRLAAAFGTRPYPTPPLGLIDGKSI